MCERMAALLRADPMWIQMAQHLRQMTAGPKVKKCAVCGKEEGLNWCSRCKIVRYVSYLTSPTIVCGMRN